jgi:hypothetical protein
MNTTKGGGEEMKIKTTFIFIMLLSMLITITPTIAAPTDGQKVEASIISHSTSYSALTQLTGSPNPYPAPITTERYFEPGHVLITGTPNPWPTDYQTMQAYSSAYILIDDLAIGSEHFTGVSCNTMHGNYNHKTQTMLLHYDATWYIGALGDLSSGFAGNVDVKIFDYIPGGSYYSEQAVHCLLIGFGDFAGQTLSLFYDGPPPSTTYTPIWTGYCLKG